MDGDKQESVANFDWQTDEDGAIFSPFVSAAWRSRRRRRLIFLAVLLAIVVFIVYRQLAQRVENRQVAVEEDVLIAFRLWQEAVARSDPEILNVLLGSGDAEWVSTQQKLLEAGVILDRSAMGLSLSSPADQGPMGIGLVVENPAVQLAQDWRRAELSFEQIYTPSDEINQIADAARLQQTVVFNFEGAHWVLGRPGDVFWGDWVTDDGSLITLVYRERDEVVAARFGRDLEAELKALCAGLTEDGFCPLKAHIRVRMESDPSVMLRMIDRQTPLFDGHTYVLPTPTLVGLPVDDEAYQALYQGYAGRIVATFASNLNSPIPIPEEKLQILCFAEFGSVPRLYRYDPVIDTWSIDLSERSFQQMRATTDDEGLILQEFLPGETGDRLRIVYWRGGSDKLLLDEIASRGIYYHIGWDGLPAEHNLILLGYGPSAELTRFGLIDMNDCPAGGCDVMDLEGFPVSAADGHHAILWRNGALYLVNGVDQSGEQVLASLGDGFGPFWLDDETYGFGRYVQRDDALMAEVVVAKVGQANPTVLFDSDYLGGLLSGSENKAVFINYVTVRPGDSRTLLVSGRAYEGDQSRFYIFSADLESESDGLGEQPVIGQLNLLFEIDGLPYGFPSVLASTGFVPFTLSPDGRWLSVSSRESTEGGPWIFTIHDIDRSETKTYTTRYPAATSKYPYYDWSADGQWLILVDNNFFRLAAPAYDYERLIPHDLKACSQVAWVK